MGVGKSTVGRRLAKKTARVFYDSDTELEKRTGAAVSLIFEVEGEAGFRERERHLVDELTALPNIVLATGGGVVLDRENRINLAGRGVVVYLKLEVDELLGRLSKDTKRPLLQTQNPEVVLTNILCEREPLYCAIADLVVDVKNLSVDDAVARIVSASSER